MSLSDLQSQEHRDLLDIIDQLRSQGISRYVDLPEIIVCGDQSAGKSSVLEAISGMSFPTKDNVCTLFATELILRRDSKRAVKVSIIPGPERFPDERDDLLQWQPEVDLESAGLKAVIEEAKIRMGLSKDFSNDILRVELSGPDQPHLTMVDLPGLFKTGNKDQNGDNVELVREMVTRYMDRPRSIILAVVSAKTEYVLQEVTALARIADPNGLRTMGLITKPDTLDSGSESERSWVDIALNKDVELTLGWHVLKNRSYDERGCTSAQRDISEERFFKSGVWKSIDGKHCGIKSLKTRLSLILKQQILRQLPSMVQDVEDEIHDCAESLQRLGAARNTTAQQKRYLTQLSTEFTSLLAAAVQGSYHYPFFGNVGDHEQYPKQLRAVVQNLLDEFSMKIHEKGQSEVIVDSDEVFKPGHITRFDYMERVRSRMLRSRGRELPGLFNPNIVSDLFAQQCKPWREIVVGSTQDIFAAAYQTTRLIIEQIAAKEIVQDLLTLIHAEIEKLKASMDDKVEELLQSHYGTHPITYNSQLIENVQSAQRERSKRAIARRIQETFGSRYTEESDMQLKLNPARIIDLFLDNTESDMIRFGSSLVVDYMQAYYQVALKRFIDDVSVIAVEGCLIGKLESIFTPTTALDFDDTELSRLVGESEHTSLERNRLSEKLQILQTGLRDIKRLHWHTDDVARIDQRYILSSNSLYTPRATSVATSEVIASRHREIPHSPAQPVLDSYTESPFAAEPVIIGHAGWSLPAEEPSVKYVSCDSESSRSF